MTQTDAPPAGPIRPHPTLDKHYSDDMLRPAYVRNLFDETAVEYDGTAALLAFGSGPWYRRHVLKLAGLKPGMTIVDVAAGTGQVTRAAAAIVGETGTVHGVEPSAGMLAQARRVVPFWVTLTQGEAEALPIPDATADFVSMGYAVRHVSDLVKAFSEYRRVLKPGGTVIVMEIGPAKGKLARAALSFWISRAVPAMHAVLGRGKGRYGRAKTLMGYYRDTLNACVPPAVIEDALRRAGFEDVKCTVSLRLCREYTGIASRPKT